MTTVTVEQANLYFESHLSRDVWITETESRKAAALAQAQRQLEPYLGRLGSDGARFFYAVCEQALWLLKDDKRAELQQAGVQGFSVGSMSEQFNTKGRPATIAPQAWAFLASGGVRAGMIR